MIYSLYNEESNDAHYLTKVYKKFFINKYFTIFFKILQCHAYMMRIVHSSLYTMSAFLAVSAPPFNQFSAERTPMIPFLLLKPFIKSNFLLSPDVLYHNTVMRPAIGTEHF